MINVLSSFKIQQYLDNQKLDEEQLNLLENTKFNELYTKEQYADINWKLQKYNTLTEEIKNNPSPEVSSALTDITKDLMYMTGKDPKGLKMSDIKTSDSLEQLMLASNIRSKNDLFVTVDYDDYSSSLNYIKCHLTSHDNPNAYGITANARMAITKSGTIITSKNALYMK